MVLSWEKVQQRATCFETGKYTDSFLLRIRDATESEVAYSQPGVLYLKKVISLNFYADILLHTLGFANGDWYWIWVSTCTALYFKSAHVYEMPTISEASLAKAWLCILVKTEQILHTFTKLIHTPLHTPLHLRTCAHTVVLWMNPVQVVLLLFRVLEALFGKWTFGGVEYNNNHQGIFKTMQEHIISFKVFLYFLWEKKCKTFITGNLFVQTKLWKN